MKQIGSLRISQTNGWGNYGSTPDEILEKVKNKADPENMIDTRADDDLNVSSQAFGSTNRITNTLDQVREALDPFVQRAIFIGLSFAVILIIWNALKLSTSGVTGNESDVKDIKGKIYNIIKGVVVITGAFLLIKLLLSAISYILQ